MDPPVAGQNDMGLSSLSERQELIRIEGKQCRATLLYIEESNRSNLRTLYDMWVQLNVGMKKFKSRRVNLPEGISESAFAIETECPRVIGVVGAGESFDCFDVKEDRRIQVKSSSVHFDLTSFGPVSEWDDLYFLDFYRDGKWDGSFDAYKIPNDLIYNYQINKTQKFRDVQALGKRPRFSIRKGLIVPYGIKPVATYKI